jgi:uncharacterized protein YjbI with pentapeptide repeats
MKLAISLLAAGMLITAPLSAAHAYDKSQLKQLLTTKVCQHCDLTGANLKGANLHGADLSFSDLTGANLRSANLGAADLRNAILIDANIANVDWRGADTSGAIFNRPIKP